MKFVNTDSQLNETEVLSERVDLFELMFQAQSEQIANQEKAIEIIHDNMTSMLDLIQIRTGGVSSNE